MPHRLRANGVLVPLTISGEYDEPEFRPNQEQKQATGAVGTWISGPPTPGAARLKLRVAVSGTTPGGCENAVEEWLVIFRNTDRFYDEVSTRFYIINGLPTLVRDKRKGRTTKHIEVDWPLLDPYFHEVDANNNVIPGSTRLSP